MIDLSKDKAEDLEHICRGDILYIIDRDTYIRDTERFLIVFKNTDHAFYSITGVADTINTSVLRYKKKTIKVECWVNVYPGGICFSYDSLIEADRYAGFTRIKCVHLTKEVEIE